MRFACEYRGQMTRTRVLMSPGPAGHSHDTVRDLRHLPPTPRGPLHPQAPLRSAADVVRPQPAASVSHPADRAPVLLAATLSRSGACEIRGIGHARM